MSVPVISVAQMREWEAATWAGGRTEEAVIALVGEKLAQHALHITRSGDLILLLAGKGHNGDDARAMRPHLREREVRVIDARDPAAAGADLAEFAGRPPALIVDGLFGIGLDRPLSREWVQLIAQVNHLHVPILAVDVPSGLNADTGEVRTAAICATETLTVGAVKRGLLARDAWPHVGRLRVLTEVGLAACPCVSESGMEWTLPEDFTGFPPRRSAAAHKGTFGHLGIVAGSLGFHGASVLAARGAQRARPGLITLFTQENIYAPVAAQLQAVMVAVMGGEPDLGRFTALLFGPGLAAKELPTSVRRCVAGAWRSFPGPVVVDASALEWLPEGDVPEGAARVITPHPGEAARLLGVTADAVQRDRLGALRSLSRKFGGCWVVLKGHQTLVGRAEGAVSVNSSGSAGLAQGGSGDVLAGCLAGWLAQPGQDGAVARALRYAVWEHGAAADRLELARGNWVVEELVAELGRERR